MPFSFHKIEIAFLEIYYMIPTYGIEFLFYVYKSWSSAPFEISIAMRLKSAR